MLAKIFTINEKVRICVMAFIPFENRLLACVHYLKRHRKGTEKAQSIKVNIPIKNKISVSV